MLLYYITDRHRLPGTAAQQRDRLLAKIAEAARAGVDLIQLRERDLSARDLLALATDALATIREVHRPESKTRLLINSRLDVALAAGADGVHLRSDDMFASDARAMWSRNAKPETQNAFVIGVSCHSLADVLSAESHGADFVVYGPVFEKQGTDVQPVGQENLRQACRRTTHDKRVEAGFSSAMQVLALGGITLANARECVAAGAAGIAAIRLFQENEIAEVVATLRGNAATAAPSLH